MTFLSSRIRNHKSALAILALVFVPLATPRTQKPRPANSFAPEGKFQFPKNAGAADLVIGDIDQDGTLDVLGPTNACYLNDGHATFRLKYLTINQRTTSNAAFLVDLDGDKQPDLIHSAANNGFASSPGQTRLFLRDKLGRFVEVTATHMPKDKDNTNDMAMGDVDGDGDLDLVLANGSIDGKKGEQNRLYLNQGKGIFKDATKTHMPVDADLSQAVVLGDLDGDGDLDLVFGNGFPWLSAKGQVNKVYLNNGKGKYSTSKVWRFGRSEVTNDVLLADLDGDGDLDLVEANGDMSQGAPNRVHANIGTPYGFIELGGAMLRESVFSTSLAVADLDEDGKLDLYVGNSRSPDRILLGNGRGSFTSPRKPMIKEDGNQTRSVVIRDLDANGHVDILCGNQGEGFRLILGLGKGEFLETTTGLYLALPSSNIQATALVDVNGDGHLDRVEAVYSVAQGQNGLWIGDGQGGFQDQTTSHMPKDRDASLDVATGDIDGDGDMDLTFANNGQNTLYLNDGTGHFRDVSATNLPRDKALSKTIVFGDVDGDKDLDILIANINTTNLLLLNDGKGRFTRASTSAFPTDADATEDLVLADLDGDGDLDVVLVNAKHRMTGSIGQQNRIYVNDGKGRFTDMTVKAMPKLLDASSAVDAADVDGDGDLDLFVGESGGTPTGGKQNRLFMNDGKGRFTDATMGRIPVDIDNTWDVRFADFDVDGDPDILLLNFSMKTMWTRKARYYLENNGKGVFTDKSSTRIGLTWNTVPAPTVADVDHDGDLDVIQGRYVFKNRFRQIHAPRLARLGQMYQISFFAETGHGNKARLAFPLISLAVLRRPIPVPPLGWLALAPGQFIVGSPFLVPGNKAFIYKLPLPRQPSLVGLSLHTQGLFLHGSSALSLRLGNWISDRLIR